MPVQLMHPMQSQVLFKRKGGREESKTRALNLFQPVLGVTLHAAKNKNTVTIKLHPKQTKGAS